MVLTRWFGILSSLVAGVVLVGLLVSPATTSKAQSVASVEVAPTTVAQNSNVTITLRGFRPEEKVTVWHTLPGFGGDTNRLDDYRVNEDGNLSLEWTVNGTQPIGIHTIGAHGNTSKRRAHATFMVVKGDSSPTNCGLPIEVTPVVGKQGETFTFSASGFGSREGVAMWLTSPSYQNIDMGRDVTGKDGSLTLLFTPDGSYTVGEYQLTVQSVGTDMCAATRFHITPGGDLDYTEASAPVLIIEPIVIQKQSLFRIEGQNFGSDEDISIWTTAVETQKTYNLGPIGAKGLRDPLVVDTEDDGFFVREVMMPDELSIGIHLVTAYGNDSGIRVIEPIFVLP
jgi:hypothetical protein